MRGLEEAFGKLNTEMAETVVKLATALSQKDFVQLDNMIQDV